MPPAARMLRLRSRSLFASWAGFSTTAAVDTAVADFPDQPEGYYYQGLVVLAQEKNDEALAAFQKYLEVAPADHEKRSEVESFVEYA